MKKKKLQDRNKLTRTRNKDRLHRQGKGQAAQTGEEIIYRLLLNAVGSP